MASDGPASVNPLFDSVAPWQGQVRAGFDANMLGQLIDLRFLVSELPEFARADRYFSPGPPHCNAEACEWLALFDAVKDARGQFTMLDLGAGFGRWMVAGACSVRRRFPGLRTYLIGVEADPTHFQWLKKHVADNDIDEKDCRLIEAAVDVDDGHVVFEEGASLDWWGQHIKRNPSQPNYGPGGQTIAATKPAISINRVLRSCPTIDLLDMDIQGAEAEVVKAGITTMTERVKRTYVSTHADHIQDELRDLFLSHGWTPVADHYPLREGETFCGRIKLDDGVHYWVNQRLIDI